jgi:hypothetical protein
MLSTTSCDDEMVFARIVCEAMIIILIDLEPVKNPYLKTFVRRLITAFILEELVLITYAFVINTSTLQEWRTFTWRTYEVIRIFISLSLCYPMSLFTGENGQKVQRLFFVVFSLMAIGGILEHMQYNHGHSGMNHIAFMLIFSFTFYQYIQLRRQTEGDIPRLKSLMIIEFLLIILDSLLLILFISGQYQLRFVSSLKIAMSILQYHKFYMIISVMSYFE